MRQLATGVALAAALALTGTHLAADDLTETLDRIADRVSQYYATAQSIVALETVRIQPETRSMSADGFARVLVYDLRVDWTAGDADHPGQANVVRQLLTVNGKPPKRGDDEAACMDPEPISPEPMTMLLPGKRDEFTFTLGGRTKTDGRSSIRLDYKTRKPSPEKITWKAETCVSVDPGRSRGQVWVDAETNDVLRLDEQVGMVMFDIPPDHALAVGRRTMTLENANTSIRYQNVTFHDPEETLVVPRSIEMVSSWSSGRVRTTQTFSKYRRFLGESHLVPGPPGAR